MFAGRRCRFRALEDTGNELIDPLSGDGVLVVSAAALAPLFPGQNALLEAEAAEALELFADAYPGRFRLLAAQCAGGRTLLLCFRPDALRLDGKVRRDLLVGVSPQRLSADGRFDALVRAE